MYGFDFTTSRYVSFEEHVGSMNGIERINIGDAAEQLSSVLSRTGGDIEAVMDQVSDNSERERVFGDVSQALATPLREDPDRLHAVICGHDSDRWILLESPEPMDFTEEIALSLKKRSVWRPPFWRDLGIRLRDEIIDLIEPRIPFRRTRELPGGFRQPGEGIGREMRTRLRRRGKMASHEIIVTIDRGRMIITDVETGRKLTRPLPRLTSIERAEIANVNLRFNHWGDLIDWWNPERVFWQERDSLVIQNGTATKAIIIPKGSNALASGMWRLDFSLTRRWFQTIDPVGPINAYIAEATIPFEGS